MDPTYRSIGDHTEAIQIDFDPSVISYEQLLEVFWGDHNPCAPAWSTQYASFIFYHDDDQKVLAEKTRDVVVKEKLRAVQTKIRQSEVFYRAEDYHQKYYLRGESLVKQIRARFDDEVRFVDSTLAARANAWAGGQVELEELEEQFRSIIAAPK